MRYAIVSDIHANWQAWSAVRNDIRKRAAGTMVCLGDIVGYGPSPTRVFADLLAHCDNFVLGNHDAAAAGTLAPSLFNENAQRSTQWTAAQFDRASLKQLGAAPLVLEDEDILFVHAEAPAPDEFGYVETTDDARACFEATEKRFIFIGHTHRPTIFALAPDGTVTETAEQVLRVQDGVRYLVNVGSVGDPGDGSDMASYCIFDSTAKEINLRKVAFDLAAFRAELEKVPELGLPWFLQRHKGELVRPSYDQAVAAGKVAGTKIRVPSSRAKIRIQASALATNAGDSLRAKIETEKAPAKKPPRSNAGLIITLISVAAIGAMAGIYFFSNPNKPAAVATNTSPAPAARAAAGAPVAPVAPVATVAKVRTALPSFRAVASREEPANIAAHAVDGNLETRWCSGDKLTGHWLQIDLGSSLNLSGMKIQWEDFELTYGYKIEGSSNTRQWMELASGSGKSADIIPFVTKTSHIRIFVTKIPDPKWASIAEVKFLDEAGREIVTAPPIATKVEATAKRERLVVVSATYGVPGDAARSRDVRDKLQRIIDGGAAQFMVGDLAQGDDPAHNVVKTLVAECAVGDRRITLTGQDQTRLSLAEFQAPAPQSAPTAAAPVVSASTAEAFASMDSLGKVPEAKDYKLVYDLDLAKLGGTVQYAVDNTASTPRFDRVAYLIELKKKGSEPAQFLWVSMDAFTTDASKLGIPTAASGVMFQQSVANITVASDAPGIKTGERIGAGNLEFWSNNYSEPNSANVPGADSKAYDFGDTPSGGAGGYGSMQVHNTAAKQTLFAINKWISGAKADLGIGNSGGGGGRGKKAFDWTFSANGESYSAKRLRVFVHPAP